METRRNCRANSKRYRIIFHLWTNEVITDTIMYPYEVFRPEMLWEE